ncbi:hypothetical protein [Halovivax cerinus]|uniref:Uncharacterized protein n=1 Tax=Halovivax cerinus TaxID=1487865 RepID=A0ABD5NIQ6_9EURY|nr:hypothetical protein [Halovivax cerinus]
MSVDDLDVSDETADLYTVVYAATKDAITDAIYDVLLLAIGFVFLGAGARAFLAVGFDATNAVPNALGGLVAVLVGGVLVAAAFDVLPRRPNAGTVRR